MLTNCPNCGAPLDIHGHCSYCKTNVVPTLDIFKSNAFGYGSFIEVNINVTDPWGKSMTIPLRGRIDTVELNLSYDGSTSVEFTFEGGIRE